MDTRRQHWETVYSTKSPSEVSWYQPVPALSLELIRGLGLAQAARIVDVGGGASTLVDHLVADGCRVSVVDIAASALAVSKARLGRTGDSVEWIIADATGWEPTAAYDVWHDRAVFHFLTEASDRRAYLSALGRAVRVGGHAIIGTFALDGPQMCSGLPIRRYDAQMLADELSDDFDLAETRTDDHLTPAGRSQRFLFCRFTRRQA